MSEKKTVVAMMTVIAILIVFATAAVFYLVYVPNTTPDDTTGDPDTENPGGSIHSPDPGQPDAGDSDSSGDEDDPTESNKNGEKDENRDNPGEDSPAGADSEADPIQKQIQSMSPEEKIGQMVIVGIDGYEADENTIAMIERYHVGGFILFGHNIESAEQLLDLVNALKRINSQKSGNKIPLFVSVDEEGGRVSRIPEPIEKIPTGKVIGEINDSDFSYEIGKLLAERIKAFGFNMNFAPVLDVNSNPDNPVIGDRSFGSDASVVARLGVQTMLGIRSEGVIPVVKHFPGHGDTSVDSHIGLPSVDHDMDRLKEIELVPFEEAIKYNADAVMIAHILMSRIDPDNPASLSKKVITDMLRRQLGFNGVVITDDMTMGAITENYDIGEAAVKAVNAGTDIVLVCHGQSNRTAVMESLIQAVECGNISMKRVDESVYRILKLKHYYQLDDNIIDSVDTAHINSRIRTVLGRYLPG